MKRFFIYIISAGGLLAIGASFIGFYVDSGFLGNFLAEVAGVGIGICIGVFLVDRLVEADRKKQWGKVRNYTLGAIASHLSDFGSDVCLFFPIEHPNIMNNIIAGRSFPLQKTPQAFQTLARELSQIKGDISDSQSTSDRTVEFYEHTKWDLDQIQTVLTPRVIQSYSEQELIDALIEFDQTRHDLHNAIISHKMIITQAPFPSLILLVESAGNLYYTLSKYWNPESAYEE